MIIACNRTRLLSDFGNDASLYDIINLVCITSLITQNYNDNPETSEKTQWDPRSKHRPLNTEHISLDVQRGPHRFSPSGRPPCFPFPIKIPNHINLLRVFYFFFINSVRYVHFLLCSNRAVGINSFFRVIYVKYTWNIVSRIDVW